MTDLFSPLQAGALTLKNRIIMAPLTRGRAGATRIPNDLMAEYYAQRASAGMIISEATAISPMGYGWANAPAIYTDEQTEAWKKITRAIHDKGGTIIMQLWHMGRITHPDFLAGELPLAPSAIAAEGFARGLLGEKKSYVTPRAMTLVDIQQTITEFASGARRAIVAGFDGVEIHGANGYLIDQFLKESSNRRTDQYGGNIQNRARFLQEICEAVANEIGADRTGLRLSALNGYNSMQDDHLPELFGHIADTINNLELAFVELREPAATQIATPIFRNHYEGVLIGNDGYDLENAQAAVAAKKLDAVAFGQKYIANPDLVARFRQQAPLNDINPQTSYGETSAGYIDYPTLTETCVS